MAEKQKHTILILEDDQQLAKAVCDALSERGLEPIVVATVEDGLKQLENPKWNIDVVWLDHYLIGAENGIDFATKMKSNPKWKDTPIFVVSNTASAPNIRAYLELGISNFYTKSDHDIAQIIGDIEHALAIKNSL